MMEIDKMEGKTSDFCVLESHSIQSVIHVNENNHELYKSLLPKNLKMPDVPQMMFYFINNSKMAFPNLNPYLEAGILLRADFPNYKGGWHVLNMAVDDEMALNAGKAVGYPKYIPQTIRFERASNGWKGHVNDDDNYIYEFNFTFKESKVTWKDTVHLWDPFYLPLKRFPRLYIIEVIKTQKRWDIRSGEADIKIISNEAWNDLFDLKNRNHPALYDEFEGKICLNYKLYK